MFKRFNHLGEVMKIIRINKLPISNSNIARSVCVGLFDGLHKGHQQLVKKTVLHAKKNKLKPSMFTFEPSPKNFLLKKNFPHLMSLQLKQKIAAKLGIEELIVLEFNQKIADLSPEQFISQILEPLNIKHLVVGFDFTYGKKGLGTAQTLLNLTNKKFSVEVVKEVNYLKQKISSTRTINALNQGDVKLAANLLGRNYVIEGIVVHGNGNGKKIGFPTANLDIGSYALPKTGVYAVKVIHNNKPYLGMANIGIHPTIKQIEKPLLEVNIFKFNRDIYGQSLQVEFIKYLRSEKKFPSLKALIKQLKSDQVRVNRLLLKLEK